MKALVRTCAALAALLSISAWQTLPASSVAAPVTIYALAVDDAGRPVLDLQPSEFDVSVDNTPQPFTAFRQGQPPLSLVVMVDQSGSMTSQRDLLTNGAVRLLARLSPADRSRIGSFAERPVLSPAFTSDHAELARTVERYMTPGHPSAMFDAVFASMDALAAEPGRRLILLLTDGSDQGSRRSLKDIVTRAQKEDHAIHAIGIRPALPPQLMDASRIDPSLKKLAGDTGGGYVEVGLRSRLDAAVDLVAAQVHSQYMLEFSPPVADGKLHELKLAVKRPGVKIVARAKFLAAVR